MIHNRKVQTILTMLILFLGLLVYSKKLEKNYIQDIESFKAYTKQADKLISLQRKWKNKEEDKKLLESIKKRFNPSVYSKNRGIYTLAFKNLTKQTLNRLGKMLLNSNLMIKKLNLKRDANKISLHVEVKI